MARTLEAPSQRGQEHQHVSRRLVLCAFVITILAGVIEIGGALMGRSLFLAADTAHLLAHTGIFGVLLIPDVRGHEHDEDRVTIAVLVMVGAIAIAIGTAAIARLTGPPELADPGLMLLSLVGLGANVAVAALFRRPAQMRWSFRAALAHELSDGSLTIAGLAGALLIKQFNWTWVDPTLSLAIAGWLLLWAGRLLFRRARLGPAAWSLGG